MISVTTNARHFRIAEFLVRFGLTPGMDVLEIGCGPGPVTRLIADVLAGNGSLLACDIDADRVLDAREWLGHFPNVEFLTCDAVEYEWPIDRYDLIVLPDSLEHVATGRRAELLTKLAAALHATGLIFIHIPSPLWLVWLAGNRPDLIQKPVDEPVWTRDLIADAERADLVLEHLETYRVWTKDDYQAIVLRPIAAAMEFVDPTP